MIALWDQTLFFLNDYGWWIALGSVLMFVVSFASIPMIVARIPIDYFTLKGHQRLKNTQRHPLMTLIIACLKNTLGAILLLAGIIMLFTPGQGLLSILFGLMVMNYPGKYRLECAIMRKPLIFNAINRMREKSQQPPLQQPEA